MANPIAPESTSTILWPIGTVASNLRMLDRGMHTPSLPIFVDVVVGDKVLPLPLDENYKSRIVAAARNTCPMMIGHVYRPIEEDFDFLKPPMDEDEEEGEVEDEEEVEEEEIQAKPKPTHLIRRNRKVYGIIKIHSWNMTRLKNVDDAIENHEMEVLMLVQSGHDLYIVLDHHIPESFVRCMMLTKWLTEEMILPLMGNVVQVLSKTCPSLMDATNYDTPI